jgi:hypothetical protein
LRAGFDRAQVAFDTWTSKVVTARNYRTGGRCEAGSLLGVNATGQGVIFLDSTSRLFSGEITPNQWTLSVTSDLNGQPSDSGVSCILAQLPPR